MSKYQLIQVQGDTVLAPVSFTVPDDIGTYQLTFKTSDGKSFTQNIDKGIKKIDKTVSATTAKFGVRDPDGVTVYLAKSTVYVGTGEISDLTATAEIGATITGVSYDSTTGIITVSMNGYSPTTTVRANVKGTLKIQTSNTYKINVTLSNGQILSSTFTV